jgi:hypothetical protein
MYAVNNKFLFKVMAHLPAGFVDTTLAQQPGV